MSEAATYCYSRDGERFHTATNADGSPTTDRDVALHEVLDDVETGDVVYTGVCGPALEDDDPNRVDEDCEYSVEDVQEHRVWRIESSLLRTRVHYTTHQQVGAGFAEWKAQGVDCGQD